MRSVSKRKAQSIPELCVCTRNERSEDAMALRLHGAQLPVDQKLARSGVRMKGSNHDA
jgi:hypothetical protein